MMGFPPSSPFYISKEAVADVEPWIPTPEDIQGMVDSGEIAIELVRSPVSAAREQDLNSELKDLRAWIESKQYDLDHDDTAAAFVDELLSRVSRLIP